MPQLVKICVTISREKLKNRTYQADREIISEVAEISESERTDFLGPAAEFLLSAMEADGVLN